MTAGHEKILGRELLDLRVRQFKRFDTAHLFCIFVKNNQGGESIKRLVGRKLVDLRERQLKEAN